MINNLSLNSLGAEGATQRVEEAREETEAMPGWQRKGWDVSRREKGHRKN